MEKRSFQKNNGQTTNKMSAISKFLALHCKHISYNRNNGSHISRKHKKRSLLVKQKKQNIIEHTL